MLYAANHAGAAASLLKAEIKDAAGRNNKQAWLMLFDLHQAAQNRADFDALSMLFTVKFEQSPPAWAESGSDAANDPRRAQSRERKDFFALKPCQGRRAGRRDRQVRHLRRGRRAPVRLDVNEADRDLGDGGGHCLAASLQRSRAQEIDADVVQQLRSAREGAARGLQREIAGDAEALLDTPLRAA